jgi:hypothetical protein
MKAKVPAAGSGSVSGSVATSSRAVCKGLQRDSSVGSWKWGSLFTAVCAQPCTLRLTRPKNGIEFIYAMSAWHLRCLPKSHACACHLYLRYRPVQRSRLIARCTGTDTLAAQAACSIVTAKRHLGCKVASKLRGHIPQRHSMPEGCVLCTVSQSAHIQCKTAGSRV